MVTLRPSLFLAVAAVIAFGATLAGSFHLDDYAIFSDRTLGSPSGWLEVWRPEQTRPLAYFTFWLNRWLNGGDPLGYHAVNLALHAGAALALFGVLRRLVAPRAALIAAALFAVHPIQTEAVAYIFARATLLATLLSLLSLGAWVRGRRWMAVAWFAAALLAKEECLALPLLFLMLDGVSVPLAAAVGLSLAAGARLAWVAAIVRGSAAGWQAGISPLDYLATQGPVILRYFRLLVLPWGYSVDPDIAIARGWAPLAAWGALAALGVMAWRRRKKEGLWILAGLALLAPSSSLFPLADLAADRRMYLPVAAFGAAAALLLARARPAVLLAGAALLTVLSVQRSLVWRSEESLWSEAERMAPGKLRPKLQLARAAGPPRALELLAQARTLAPDDPAVPGELGRLYLASGDPARALAEFGRALALAPGDARALNNRGAALLALDQREAAREDFLRALAMDPTLEEARENLARLATAPAAK